MTEQPDNFEVKNEEIRSLLRMLAEFLGRLIPEGWGFTLMLFEFGTEGALFYISSAIKEDMIKAMKEFIAKQEKKESDKVQ